MKNFILLSSIFLLLNSCGKNKCSDTGDSYSIYGSLIMLEVTDKTGKHLIGDHSIYKEADIKASDVTGKELELRFYDAMSSNSSGSYRQILITSFINDTEDIDGQVCNQTLFINYGLDQDTIDYCYKKQKRQCFGPHLENLSIKYNGKSIEGETGEFGFKGVVIK